MLQEIRTQGYGNSVEEESSLHGFTEKGTFKQGLENYVSFPVDEVEEGMPGSGNRV